MNIKKSLVALTLVSAFGANASSINIDVGTNYDGIYGGDADSLTGFFDAFTFGTFEPTSAYIDFDGNGLMEQGNLVFDSAFEVPVSTLNFTADTELLNDFFNNGYSLSANYEFYGVAGFDDSVIANGTQDTGEAIGAQFLGGYFDLFLTDDATGTQSQVLALDITGSSADLGTSGLNYNISSDIVGIASDFMFFEDAVGGYTEIVDILTLVPGAVIEGVITTEITNAGETPTLDTGYVATQYQIDTLQYMFGYDYDTNPVNFLTRTTTLDSANLYINNVSEPASLAIFGLGLLGLAGAARRRKA